MMTIEELEKKMAELDELQAETENAHAKLKAQMAELEELQAESENAHAKLIAQMAELKERGEEKPKPPHPRWKPEEGEYYYWFTGQGTPSQDKWVASACDRDLYNIGNVFFDLKTAEFAAERLKVLAEMREWAGNWNDTWVMIYDGWSPKAISIHAPDVTFGELRFATREDAEGCIKAVGKDRLIKYYFGVRDHEIPAETE